MHEVATDSDVDADIAAALGRRDRRTALQLMMDTHGEAIYRFCRRMVGEAALADDAHQQTFIQAYEALEHYEGRSSIRTWLYAIARHRCLDALKMRGRRRARFVPLPEPHDPAGAVDADLDGQLHADRRRSRLVLCLGRLEAKSRVAVVLRFHEELSYPQMADVCGERAPTLQARVARALPVLRRCLEGEEATP